MEKNWYIQKNALGVILSRYHIGFVLMHPPKDAWCVLHKFTLTEPYAGGQRYSKANGLSQFGVPRFQKCK